MFEVKPTAKRQVVVFPDETPEDGPFYTIMVIELGRTRMYAHEDYDRAIIWALRLRETKHDDVTVLTKTPQINFIGLN